MLSFFRNFFKNIVADPASSLKGVLSLAAGALAVYGMAKGNVPVNELSIGMVSAATTSGIHALGSGPNKDLAPGEAVLTSTIETATAVLPAALTITDHYEAIRRETDKATAVLAAVQEISTGLATITPQPAVTLGSAPGAAGLQQ